jgi:acetylornithine deacetylase
MKCGFAMGVLAIRSLLEDRGARWALTLVAAIEEECTGNGTLATAADGVWPMPSCSSADRS